jgi:hypothetical protein
MEGQMERLIEEHNEKVREIDRLQKEVHEMDKDFSLYKKEI